MSVEIRVPQMGESVVEATVLRWLKREGEAVAAGEPVVELETDKVNVEVPAEQAGTLTEIRHREGDTVTIGEPLAVLADGTAQAEDRRQETGDGMPETGDKREELREAALPAPDYGKQQMEEIEDLAASDNGNATPGATPVAARMAVERRVDLRQVRGTGPGGKVTKEDVANYLERQASSPRTARTIAEHASRPAAEPLPAVVPAAESAPAERPEERVRMSRRRQTIAARLVEAQRTAAMLTTFNEIDMSAVMEIRKRRRDVFKERYGVGLGFMSFFTRAAIGALKAFPLLNAEIQGDEIVMKRYYDIGVAVSTDEGLVVPVLRSADSLTFAEIEKGIGELATRAREGKLTLPELMGGTFTITNGGVFGSLMSTPILNTPQSGILGMHKIQERPVALDGQVAIRPMMYVALSYDHRLVDGSEAVRFLVRVKDLVEDPGAMLVEG